MAIINHRLYEEDLDFVASLPLDWERLSGKTFLISGASGNIGGFLIDVLRKKDIGIKILALGRNEAKARERFASYWDEEDFIFVPGDINKEISIESDGNIDFVFHAASNTHPADYAGDPIGTITTNVIGANNMLKLAAERGCERFVYASSVEIYGENRGDAERFDESYLGYIDCNSMRAGYPESKRTGEALCQAYRAKHGLDAVAVRFSRTYGPTLLSTDTKAISQFLHKGVAREDIVLKSEGTQTYSYSYVADAVSAFLYCLLYGTDGEAYNVADEGSDVSLKDLANIVAEYAGRRVVFELPDAKEASGYSKATKAMLDSSKLKGLGWRAHYDMKEGIKRTLEMLSEQAAVCFIF